MVNKSARNRSIILAILITIVLSLFAYYLYKDYKGNLAENNKALLEKYNEEYSTIISGYRKLSALYFDEIINDEQILKIIYEADKSDEASKDELRNELISLMDNSYSKMKDNNFRQLHFALSDSTSFLRMHKKDSYGDYLADVRETVAISNNEQRYVEGFEEGRVFNGYRFEYPLFHNNEHIGCVDVSVSFLSVIELMDQSFNIPTQFIIKKTVVDNKVWEEIIGDNYKISRISDDYYYDSACSEYISSTGKYINLFEEINDDKDLRYKIGKLLKDDKSFVINYEARNNRYAIVFKNINNVQGESVGYLEFYDIDNEAERLYSGMITELMLVFSLWLLILMAILGFYLLNKEIQNMSYYDKLTGVLNRNKLYESIERDIKLNERYNQEFSLLIFDIDNFKKINDKYGHLMGDRVIKEIADLVQSNIRSTDLLFRFGGDEFVVLLSNTEIAEGKVVSEKIRQRISDYEYPEEVKGKTTISIGLTEYNTNESVQELLNRADKLLYKAKEQGRNRTIAEKAKS